MDEASRICAGMLTVVAAINMGDYPLYVEKKTYLKDKIKANKSANATVLAGLALDTAYVEFTTNY